MIERVVKFIIIPTKSALNTYNTFRAILFIQNLCFIFVDQNLTMQEIKIKDYLTENGVRPMNKRVKIMNYLVTRRNHPTAEMIYLELVNEIAGLSKTTVYNTLNLFVQEGITRALNIDSNELRYDADISQHGHFKCKACHEVYDFSMNDELLQDQRLKNFILDDFQFSIKGVCSFCLKRKNVSQEIKLASCTDI